jgi:hypothetical protein
MLLRRIIEHTNAQNWTAIMIDFVIVVVGVFIGIQAANRNEQMAFERREQVLTKSFAVRWFKIWPMYRQKANHFWLVRPPRAELLKGLKEVTRAARTIVGPLSSILCTRHNGNKSIRVGQLMMSFGATGFRATVESSSWSKSIKK